MKIRGHQTINGKDAKLASGHFNGGEHLFVEVDGITNQTISCILPGGGFVTFAFLPHGDGKVESVDIHSTVGKQFKYKPTDDKGDVHYVQHAIGFSRNGDTFDTRKVNKPTGLMTVLLHPSHHA